MYPRKSTKLGPLSRPFTAADHLRDEAELTAYMAAMIEDGDPRALSVALRTVAGFMGSKILSRPGRRDDRGY